MYRSIVRASTIYILHVEEILNLFWGFLRPWLKGSEKTHGELFLTLKRNNWILLNLSNSQSAMSSFDYMNKRWKLFWGTTFNLLSRFYFRPAIMQKCGNDTTMRWWEWCGHHNVIYRLKTWDTSRLPKTRFITLLQPYKYFWKPLQHGLFHAMWCGLIFALYTLFKCSIFLLLGNLANDFSIQVGPEN